MCEEPPTNDKLHVEVVSTSSRMGLLHGKVQITSHFCLVCKLTPILDNVVYTFYVKQLHSV